MRVAPLCPLQIAEVSPDDFMAASALWPLGQRSSGLHTLIFSSLYLWYFLGVRRDQASTLSMSLLLL